MARPPVQDSRLAPGESRDREVAPADGREIEVGIDGGNIAWRYVGAASWQPIIAISELVGPPGDAGPPGAGGNSVAVVVDFGATFTQWAQTVVTGLPWVEADSKILPAIAPASGKAMESALFNFRPVVFDVVAGVGFTLGVFTDVKAKGTYTFNCMGG